MNKIKRSFYIIRDFFEIYLPLFAFIVMFLTFIIQIIARYIFKFPLTWAYEVTVIGFSWTVILGACYAMRSRSHVKFTLIYDMLSPKKAAFIRMLGNLIILFAFVALIVPSFEYVKFMDFQSTSVFKIKLSWIFSAFIYFVFSMIGYTAVEIYEDFCTIRGKTKQSLESGEQI
ncbi:TRAP transporter small permease [Fusibacter bizertensis]|uniref:TRAP transporter small permease n=1 Tax=Fusibacter bizertensis TaxID=1488331 RepID=A0ABT6NAA3_9FIRM|nr:TRAP transporter small permease [Fusibacter bizertensis]MDH8677345.1 TRAP transporter small permease [Fusibacter bizertensis]